MNEDYVGVPTVFVQETEESSVLDKNGNPYSFSRREPVGFLLKNKKNNKETK